MPNLATLTGYSSLRTKEKKQQKTKGPNQIKKAQKQTKPQTNNKEIPPSKTPKPLQKSKMHILGFKWPISDHKNISLHNHFIISKFGVKMKETVISDWSLWFAESLWMWLKLIYKIISKNFNICLCPKEVFLLPSGWKRRPEYCIFISIRYVFCPFFLLHIYTSELASISPFFSSLLGYY